MTVNTLINCAGRGRKGRRIQAHIASLLLPPLKACPAGIARPSQDLLRAVLHSVRGSKLEGKGRGQNLASDFGVAAREPAVRPTVPTPKILSAINKNRSENPPGMFLRGDAPFYFETCLRPVRTIPPHTGKPAIVCLDAFDCPRGNWRG